MGQNLVGFHIGTIHLFILFDLTLHDLGVRRKFWIFGSTFNFDFFIFCHLYIYKVNYKKKCKRQWWCFLFLAVTKGKQKKTQFWGSRCSPPSGGDCDAVPRHTVPVASFGTQCTEHDPLKHQCSVCAKHTWFGVKTADWHKVRRQIAVMWSKHINSLPSQDNDPDHCQKRSQTQFQSG